MDTSGKGLVFAGLFFTGAMAARAEGTNITDTGTNDTAVSYAVSFEATNFAPTGFWDAYRRKWHQSGHLFVDRFGYPAAADLVEQMGNERSDFFRQQALSLRNTMARAGIDSLRDTTVDMLPLEQWEKAASDTFRGWFGDAAANLIDGSVGNTVEQQMDIDSISYSATEAVWRDETRVSDHVRYGIRPGSSPYAYLSASIGSLHQRPIAITDMRWYIDPSGSQSVKCQIVIPFSDSVYLNGGFSGDPLNGSAHGRDPPTGWLRLEKVIGHRRYIDDMSAGISFGGSVNVRLEFSKKL